NKYEVEDAELVDVLDIDNAAVLAQQVEKLQAVRADRDDDACRQALEELTRGARGEGNLLALCVEAARARATVGEMSEAMEEAFGRHAAEVKTGLGTYAASYQGDEGFRALTERVDTFAESEGRRPQIGRAHV